MGGLFLKPAAGMSYGKAIYLRSALLQDNCNQDYGVLRDIHWAGCSEISTTLWADIKNAWLWWVAFRRDSKKCESSPPRTGQKYPRHGIKLNTTWKSRNQDTLTLANARKEETKLCETSQLWPPSRGLSGRDIASIIILFPYWHFQWDYAMLISLVPNLSSSIKTAIVQDTSMRHWISHSRRVHTVISLCCEGFPHETPRDNYT